MVARIRPIAKIFAKGVPEGGGEVVRVSMDTQNDDAIGWMLAFLENGDGAIDPQTLTQAGLREFVWWVLDPKNYREFVRMVKLDQRVRRFLPPR